MSTSMVRAMGWGMPWSDFEMLTLLDCEGHETYEALEAAMDAASVEDLTVPMDLRNALYYSNKRPRQPTIFDPVLLAKDLEFEGDGDERHRSHTAGFFRPADLWVTANVGGEEISHVLFWPTGSSKRENYRSRDILDVYFEQYRDGTSDGGMRDFVYEMKFNPYGHANNIMDPATGAPLEWDSFHRLDKTYPNRWAPNPPSELRWYLPKLGILDEAGVIKLRPMLCQWWS